ncbi:SDR family oxidoreductase [Brucella gallinifaecis]|uniref:SDR family oxidoreductase n=1 Tax=Brucella gallinifaecis TaxID=215590 RepID=A0A502BN35_9HYPH|nr:SDR family oxidoreductase [Brucella gallinifaecis]TPF74706.1 SDR family oxidoreductase [Brucella gallinifaecis]
MARPRAVISGATSGIGRAIALRLAEDGYDVLALGTNPVRLKELETVDGVDTRALDITDAASVSAVLGETVADVFVHAAGVLGAADKLYEMTPETAAEILNVNVIGTINLLRALVPAMVEKQGGYVILLGSVAGKIPGNGPTLYSASKAAVSALSAGLRNDLHGSGVRVTEILPGRVRTGMHQQLAKGDFYDGYECLQPEDIATTVAHLISLPVNVDVSQMEILPTDQVLGGSLFWSRKTSED